MPSSLLPHDEHAIVACAKNASSRVLEDMNPMLMIVVAEMIPFQLRTRITPHPRKRVW